MTLREPDNYEYRINGGEIKTCTFYGVDLRGIAVPIGGLEIRTKAMDGNPASDWISNELPFFNHTGLPRIDIAVPVHLINPDTKTEGVMSISNNFGSFYESKHLYSGGILIKVRGNSTAQNPKKPYGIELITSGTQVKIDFPLLGFATSNEWVLLAEYWDASVLRNKTMLSLANMVNSPRWHPSAQSVEVYLNGNYNGVYTLTPKLERGTGRVDLSKLEITDLVEPKISGGYLLEVAVAYQEVLSEIKFFTTPRTNPEPIYNLASLHSVKYPKPENLNQNQLNYISSYVNAFEEALFNVSFDDLNNGYRNYLDIPCAVDHYLLQEFAKNCDGPSHSLYYSKNRNEKIKMGPIWDLDYSFAQIDFAFYPDGLYMNRYKWYERLLQDPYFLNQVKTRYTALRSVFLDQRRILSERAFVMNQSGAAINNRNLWGVHTQQLTIITIPDTYMGEIERVNQFITDRVAFLDTVYLITV